MQDLLITLLLAAHLLAMNVAAAGPLVGAWLAGRSDGGRRWSLAVYRLSFMALLFGALIGGALLLWPSEHMSAALGRFPSDAYWYAAVELLFSGACIAALILGGDWLGQRRLLTFGLALLTTTNLLYHFPPLMAVLGELAADPTWASEQVLDRSALLRLWRRPEILALWAHFVLASFAVASVVALWPRSPALRKAVDPAVSSSARRLGGVALAASLLQLPAGVWLLWTSGGPQGHVLMGGDLAATLYFTGGMLAVPLLLYALLAVTLGEERRAVVRASYLLIIVTVLMTATLRKSRGASGADAPLSASAISVKQINC